MLFLKNTPINQILSLHEMIETIEDTLKELAAGRGFDLPRRRIHHPNRMIFGLLPGSVHGVMGAYLQTDLDRQVHHETVILYSVETGEPLILFQDCSINEYRTGAAGAIGAKYLARDDAKRVAILGSAVHAETQLRAVAAVRNLTQAWVFSPTPAHRQAFAETLSQDLKFPVVATSSAEDAVENADIVITATNSRSPVFDGSRLQEGAHITSIANGDKTRTRQEIDEITIRRANPIFVTSKETLCVNESDIFRAVRDRVTSWDRVHEISGVLLGALAGRADDRQITLYKLQGTGIMDVAIGLRAFEKIKDDKAAQRL
ncbi:MAG TPA: ornithine cyclodeaminase family protein [Candidatus Binatia bacterium]|jgi:ornithine cyclodeaminase/alanine dehydrogenase-like protein (mu-crystallin family)|nr:ornithine cyclodeaminase family protein [Candidatus Binatia bacterium]